MTILIVALSLIAHEYAHVFAVKFLGGKIERVGFFPLGMMARTRQLERLSGRERYVIYAAGPMANFALVLWAAIASHVAYVYTPILDAIVFYNLVLGLFNLTPVLPLDGGRILWQFLGNKIGILRAARIVKRLGLVVGCVFIFLGMVQIVLFPYNLTLLCAGVFIMKKGRRAEPWMQAEFHLALDGKSSPTRVRTLPVKRISVPAEMPVKDAFERLAGDYFIEFCVDEMQVVTERALLAHIFKHGLTGTIGTKLLMTAIHQSKF